MKSLNPAWSGVFFIVKKQANHAENRNFTLKILLPGNITTFIHAWMGLCKPGYYSFSQHLLSISFFIP